MLRIKRVNGNNRMAYAYSLAPKPKPKQMMVVDVTPVQPTLTPIDRIIKHIPQMSIADATRLRDALDEVLA